MKYIIIISVCILSCMMTSPVAAGDRKIHYNGYVSADGASVFSKKGQGALANVETCHGIEIDKRAFFGFGTGASYSIATDEVLIPIFITSTVSFSNTAVVPFVEARIGALFNTNRNSNMISLIPAIGITYSRLFLSFGYEFLGAVDKDWVYSGGLENRVRTYTNSNGFRLTIGVKFR